MGMATTPVPRAPVNRLAVLSIAIAVIAGVMALYGSMHAEKHIAGSPLRAARGNSGQPSQPGSGVDKLVVKAETKVFGTRLDDKMQSITSRSKIANYIVQIVAYILPFVLGLIAAFAGGSTMKAVRLSNGKTVGNTLAVFAVLLGGLASVVAGCMLVSLYLWPLLPAFYTT
jgi:hypothetical protein